MAKVVNYVALWPGDRWFEPRFFFSPCLGPLVSFCDPKDGPDISMWPSTLFKFSYSKLNCLLLLLQFTVPLYSR